MRLQIIKLESTQCFYIKKKKKKKKKKKASSKIGFLSVLPHRIAKYEALCKFLQNFINILGQLEQNNFTIFCDEGVKLQGKHCSRNQVSSKVSYCVLVLSIWQKHFLLVLRSTWRGVDELSIWTWSCVLNGYNYECSIEDFLPLGEHISCFLCIGFLQESVKK